MGGLKTSSGYNSYYSVTTLNIAFKQLHISPTQLHHEIPEFPFSRCRPPRTIGRTRLIWDPAIAPGGFQPARDAEQCSMCKAANPQKVVSSLSFFSSRQRTCLFNPPQYGVIRYEDGHMKTLAYMECVPGREHGAKISSVVFCQPATCSYSP